jgi:type II secretion system protein J
MNRKGFTLFEVLMALAILGVVFSLLYMIFHQSMTVMAGTEDQTEVVRQGRLILERMTLEIQGCFISSNRPKSGPPAFHYGLVGRSNPEGVDFIDRLDFSAAVPSYVQTAERKGDVQEIGYFLEHEPGGQAMTLFRRQDEAIDGDLLQGGTSLAICDRVRSLRFAFFDRQGKKQKEWNSLEGEHRYELPGRIEIYLKLEDARGKTYAFQTQVYLPLAGGEG